MCLQKSMGVKRNAKINDGRVVLKRIDFKYNNKSKQKKEEKMKCHNVSHLKKKA
jgi:hypothetical protein